MAKLTDGVANALLDALTQMLNGGWLDILTGDGTMLATLHLDNPAFEPATGRSATARALERDRSAPSTGKPASYRLVTADRKTTVQEGTAGGPGSGADLEMRTEQIVKGAEVRIDSFVLRMR